MSRQLKAFNISLATHCLVILLIMWGSRYFVAGKKTVFVDFTVEDGAGAGPGGPGRPGASLKPGNGGGADIESPAGKKPGNNEKSPEKSAYSSVVDEKKGITSEEKDEREEKEKMPISANGPSPETTVALPPQAWKIADLPDETPEAWSAGGSLYDAGTGGRGDWEPAGFGPGAPGAGAGGDGPGDGGSRGDLSGSGAGGGYLKRHFSYIREIISRNLTYPDYARRMGWAGTVIVSFVVEENGDAADIKVVKSSGFKLLDANALDAIRRSSPFPRPPVKAELKLPVSYKFEQ